jgi:putative transposase
MARRRKIKRRIPNPAKQMLLQPTRPNLTWSLDFMEDRLDNGRKFRTLNISSQSSLPKDIIRVQDE